METELNTFSHRLASLGGWRQNGKMRKWKPCIEYLWIALNSPENNGGDSATFQTRKRTIANFPVNKKLNGIQKQGPQLQFAISQAVKIHDLKISSTGPKTY
jgi:hypothetical protein